MELQNHWNQIYEQKAQSELGWYETDAQVTIDFLADVLKEKHQIIVPGAGTSTLVPSLVQAGHKLILNDLSDVALAKLKYELNGFNEQVSFVVNDLGAPLSSWKFEQCSLWIDRAVLHFLTQKEQIQNYFDRLKNSVQKEGYVLFAEFRKGGAEKCALLPILQWDLNELTVELGSDFELVKSMEYDFINPRGEARPYIYALFKRLK